MGDPYEVFPKSVRVRTKQAGKTHVGLWGQSVKSGMSQVLMQHGRMIVYASHQVKDFEKNYPTYDLELATVVFALKMLRHYLYDVNYDIYTDQKNLKYIFIQKELNM